MKQSVWNKIKDVMLWIKWAVVAFFGWLIVDGIKASLKARAEKKKLTAEVKKAETETGKLVKKNEVLEKDAAAKEKEKSVRDRKTNKFFKIITK